MSARTLRILTAVLVWLALPVASWAQDKASAAAGDDSLVLRVGIRDFRKKQGSARLETLEQMLPQLLKAGLFSQTWLDVSLAGKGSPAGTARTQPGAAQDLGSGSANFDLLIEGEFIEISDDEIRLDFVVTDVLRRGPVHTDTLMLELPQLVPQMGEAASRLVGVLRDKVLLPRAGERLVVVAGPFEKNLTDANLSSLDRAVPLAIAESAAKTVLRKNAVIRPILPGVTGGAPGEKWDVRITGKISAADGTLRLAGTYQEQGTGLSIPIEFSGAAAEPLKAADSFSRKVLEALTARISPKGGFRDEPLLAANSTAPQLIARAQELEKANEWNVAAFFYGLALRKKPDDVATRLKLADIYRERDALDSAEEQYKLVLAQSSQNAAAHFGLGALQQRRSNYEQAAKELELALSLAAADNKLKFDALMKLGDVYLSMRDPDRSVGFYSQAEALQRTSPAPYIALAKASRAQKNLDGAISYLTKGVAQWPSDKTLKNDLASALIDQGVQRDEAKEYTRALESYMKAVDLNAPDTRVMATAYRNAGIVHGWRLRDFNKAIPLLQSAVRIDPGRDQNHLVLGWALRDMGQYKDAAAALRKAISITPKYDSYYQLALAQRALGEYDGGIDSIKKALEIEPRNAAAFVLLGALHESKFKRNKDKASFDQGVENLTRAIELSPQSEPAHRILGVLYSEAGDYENAVAYLQRANRISPTVWSYSMLGESLWKQKKTEEAIAAYMEGLKIDRRYQNIYDDLEDLYTELKQPEKFLALLQETTQADPRYVFPYIKLGMVYRREKKLDDSAAWLEKALAVDPNNEWALRNMGITHIHYGEAGKGKPAYETAVSYLNKALQSDQASNETKNWAYAQLGKAYAGLGDDDKAIASLQKALDLNLTYQFTYETLEPLYTKAKRTNEFVRLLEVLVAKDPGSYWGRMRLVSYYWDRNRIDDIIEHATKASELRPKASDPYVQLAHAYRNKKETAKAYEFAKRAVELNPRHSELRLFANIIFFDQKQPAKAAPELLALLKNNPETAAQKAVLAESYWRSKAFPKAYEYARKALQQSAEYPYALWVLGQTYSEEKKYAEAAASAWQAVKISPEYTDGLVLLRDANHKMGKDQETIALCEQLLAEKPQSYAILSILGYTAHEYTRDHEKAYETFRKLSEMYPDDLTVVMNFAEACLTSNRPKEMLGVAEKALALTEREKSAEAQRAQARLSMKLFQVAAYLLQGDQGRAFAELGSFRDEYSKVPKDFNRSWTYEGTTEFIKNRSGLRPPEAAVLLRMIDLLGASQQEADAKLRQFEDSFSKLLADLKSGSAAEKAGKSN